LPFESDVSEMCDGLIVFRAAAFVTKYGSDITVREHFELKKHLVQIVNLKSASPTVASAF